MDAAWFQGLRWRCIGPPRGGRVVAVAGHPTEPMVFYFGAVAGGVWKTTDGGTYWENVSDGYFRTSAIGALAVAESDPNVVYAGTGEATIRIDVVLRRRRLQDDRRRQDVDPHGPRRHPPHRPDPGPPAGSRPRVRRGAGPRLRPERRAGRVPLQGRRAQLGAACSSGASGPGRSTSPSTERIPASSTPRRGRSTGTSGRSRAAAPTAGSTSPSDGGDTWTDLTDNPGLPKGIKGKIGVTVSPARPDRVWAIVEAEKAGLYRSDDGGRTWELVSDNRDLIHRPWYYCHVFADPVGRRHRLRHQPQDVEVDRRRADLHGGHDAPRRQPRPVDRSAGPATDDRGQRRRRLRLVQRRPQLVHDLQPAHRAVLSRGRRRPVSRTASTGPSRTTRA